MKLVPHGLRDAQQWIDYQFEGKVRGEQYIWDIHLLTVNFHPGQRREDYLQNLRYTLR